jgi:hypothetical protein
MVDLRNDRQRARDSRREAKERERALIARREAMVRHIIETQASTAVEFAQYRQWPKGSRRTARGWHLGTHHYITDREATHTTYVLTDDGLVRVLDPRTETLEAYGSGVADGFGEFVDQRLAALASQAGRG